MNVEIGMCFLSLSLLSFNFSVPMLHGCKILTSKIILLLLKSYLFTERQQISRFNWKVFQVPTFTEKVLP